MTTATGRFTVSYDDTTDACPWTILDEAGEFVDCFDVMDEAIEEAGRLAAEEAEEKAEEAATEKAQADLDEIGDYMANLDPSDADDRAKIAKILKLVKKLA